MLFQFQLLYPMGVQPFRGKGPHSWLWAVTRGAAFGK